MRMENRVPFIAGRSKGPRVLVVEDNEALRRVVVGFLRYWGCETNEARDGEEAIALIETHGGSFDVLLLDIMLPKVDGIEVAATTRRIRPELEIVVCSGSLDATIIAALESTGVRFFISKPFLPERLREAIRQACESGVGADRS